MCTFVYWKLRALNLTLVGIGKGLEFRWKMRAFVYRKLKTISLTLVRIKQGLVIGWKMCIIIYRKLEALKRALKWNFKSIGTRG